MREEASPNTGWRNVFHAIARNAVLQDKTPMTFSKAIGWALAFAGLWFLAEILIAVVKP